MKKIFLFLLPAVMLFAAGCKDKNEPEQGQSQEQGQGQGEEQGGEQGGTQTDTLRVYTVFDAASG
ncbi:MAG: hypothetical protein IJ047_04640, partial [Paludibacteraceae bacterium]|nr:hypothetical protein [Paludibacteraceae bacterium]